MRLKVILLLSTVIVVVFLLGIEPNSRVRPLFLRNVLALRMTRKTETVMLNMELPAATRLGEVILTLSPDDWGVRRLLGTAYLQNGDAAKAISTLKAEVIHCSDPLTCFLQGQALYRMNRTAEALSRWRETPHVDVYFAIQGDHSYARGARAEAARNYALSWQIAPTVTVSKRNMFLNLCREQRTGGHAAAAIEWCERAVLANKDHWVLVELGRTYHEAGQYNLAEAALREAIGLLPKQAGAYQWLGATLIQVGLTEEAIRVLDASVQLDPTSVWARLELANALANLGAYAAALCEYTQALTLTQDQTQKWIIQEKIELLPTDHKDLQLCGDLGSKEP